MKTTVSFLLLVAFFCLHNVLSMGMGYPHDMFFEHVMTKQITKPAQIVHRHPSTPGAIRTLLQRTGLCSAKAQPAASWQSFQKQTPPAKKCSKPTSALYWLYLYQQDAEWDKLAS